MIKTVKISKITRLEGAAAVKSHEKNIRCAVEQFGIMKIKHVIEYCRTIWNNYGLMFNQRIKD